MNPEQPRNALFAIDVTVSGITSGPVSLEQPVNACIPIDVTVDGIGGNNPEADVPPTIPVIVVPLYMNRLVDVEPELI